MHNLLEKHNCSANRALGDVSGFINGQRVSRAGKMRFGLCSLANVGSGIIAAYNLLLLLNRRMPLADVTREIYLRARTPLGLFGAHPLKLIRCFSAHYLPVNLDRNYNSFCSKFKPGCCGIVFMWTGRKFLSEIHAVAIENDRGKIYVYNRIPSSPKRYEFNDIGSLLSKPKKFVIGYYINGDEFYN